MTRNTRIVAGGALGYVLGTFPSARVATWVATGGTVDIRRAGTGNPGAMNVRRVVSKRVGASVMTSDVVKGVLACSAGRRFGGEVGAQVAGVAAVAGHCYPAWFGFRGGLGVATSFGQCLATFPAYAPLDVAVAVASSRIPGVKRRATVAVAISSVAWLTAAVIWSARGWPNLWRARAGSELPLGAAGTVAVIASRALTELSRKAPDELLQGA